MSEKSKSKYFHLVMSPKDCPDPDILSKYLLKNSLNHVLSIEYGDSGHKHLECFYELSSEKRSDHQKRSIMLLYPDIPEAERRNVKVVVNKLDPSPSYGYGYALKEGNVYSSTFDEFEHADFLKYYLDHKEFVVANIDKFRPKSVGFTVEEFSQGCCDFVIEYCKDHSLVDIQSCIDLYVSHIGRGKISFTNYQRISFEKLERYIRSFLGREFLTAPSSNPLYLPN